MATIPGWEEETTDGKMELLHQWCDNLSRKVMEIGGTIQGLHERLRVAEARLAETSALPKP